MPTSYLWQLWPGRHWPLSAQEELTLITELENQSHDDSSTFDRGDVTAVLNMIRLGLSFREVKAHAPGLVAERLLAAHRFLERRRDESAQAFVGLLNKPNHEAASASAPLASRLLPIPTFLVMHAINDNSERLYPNTASLDAVIHQVSHDVKAATKAANAVETRLHTLATAPGGLAPRPDVCVALGRSLYDPYDECLWSRPFFLPTRVGVLVPTRVADLLGERPA